MPNGGGVYGHGGMYPPPLPRGGEFNRRDGYGYYTVGTLRRATGAAWEWVTPHMVRLSSGR